MPSLTRYVKVVCDNCGKVIQNDKEHMSFEQYQKLSGDTTTPKPCQSHNEDFDVDVKPIDRGPVQFNKKKQNNKKDKKAVN